ncbi:MAG: hypothetical protein FWE24_00345 [Defluviitaleaceae bacterium]|nr:hypothetical protein [Defluviitaleaceae bacterium]
MRGKISLLKIVSIPMILLGVYAFAVEILAISSLEQGFRHVSSITASVACITAGFFGILSKSMKNILIIGILLLIATIFDIVVGIGFFGMGIFHLTLFVWPILYLWGWHISNRKMSKPQCNDPQNSQT